jgi:predicted Zn-dependent peptidase
MSTVLDIRQSKLSNGMTVITDFMPSVETVSLGVWVNAGTRHEAAEINGISHLLEHMAFKGTERRTAREIAEEIEAVGGLLNAYTSRDHTAYYAKILKQDVPLGVDILADILLHSSLDSDELAREQAVVVQEISQAIDTPDDIIFDHFQTTAFPNQAVGRPVLGTADLVRSFSRQTVSRYMRDHYGSGTMILAAAGNLDHDHLVAEAERHFEGLAPARIGDEEQARYLGGDYREERDLEQVHVVLGFDGVSYEDPDFYAMSVLSGLLGGGMSSRLFQEVRERRGLAYSVYSFSQSLTDGGLFSIYAGTGPEESAEVVPVICEEVRKVTQSVTADEVRRSRAQIKAGILMGLESTNARCEQLARQLMVHGRILPIEELVAQIDAVDEAAVLNPHLRRDRPAGQGGRVQSDPREPRSVGESPPLIMRGLPFLSFRAQRGIPLRASPEPRRHHISLGRFRAAGRRLGMLHRLEAALQEIEQLPLGPAFEHFGDEGAARCQHGNGEIKRHLAHMDDAHVIGRRMAGRRGGHVGQHHIGRPPQGIS